LANHGSGAIAVLATLQITPLNALKSINLDVIFFLFGMFIVGEALVNSGYLSYLSYKLFRRAKSLDSLVLFILFGIGIMAAFLMNDTLANYRYSCCSVIAGKAKTSPKNTIAYAGFRGYYRQRHKSHRQSPEPAHRHQWQCGQSFYHFLPLSPAPDTA